MLYYVIDHNGLWDKIFAEVSQVADAAYSDNGVSLYDSIILTEKDRDIVKRFVDDAISVLVRRAFDICKYSPMVHYVMENEAPTEQIDYIEPRLAFYVPDFDTSMEDAVKAEIDTYITMYACSSLFQQRRAALVPEYTNRTQSAMDKAVTLLKSRKDPYAQW